MINLISFLPDLAFNTPSDHKFNFTLILTPTFASTSPSTLTATSPVPTANNYFLTPGNLHEVMDPAIEKILAVSDRAFLHDVLRDLCMDSEIARQAVLEHFTTLPDGPKDNMTGVRDAAVRDQVSFVLFMFSSNSSKLQVTFDISTVSFGLHIADYTVKTKRGI